MGVHCEGEHVSTEFHTAERPPCSSVVPACDSKAVSGEVSFILHSRVTTGPVSQHSEANDTSSQRAHRGRPRCMFMLDLIQFCGHPCRGRARSWYYPPFAQFGHFGGIVFNVLSAAASVRSRPHCGGDTFRHRGPLTLFTRAA